MRPLYPDVVFVQPISCSSLAFLALISRKFRGDSSRRGSTLERHANGEDEAVVVGMEVGEGDLVSGAEGESGTADSLSDVRQGDAADEKAGGGEGHCLSIVGSADEEAGVDFGFGPEEARRAGTGEAILHHAVPGDGVAEFFSVAGWERSAGGGGEGEQAKAFSDRQGGGGGGAATAVGVLAGGNRAGHEGSDDGVAVLLVSGEEAVFGVEGDVAKAILDA